jgi:uncharacterized membrane protein YfcA
VTSGEVAATLAVLALASMVQATAGFGFALLSMPLLSAVIGPTPALAVTSMVSIVNSGTTAVTSHGDADRATLRRTIVAALVGMPLGLVVLEAVSVTVMQVLIAVTVAAAALAIGVGVRVRPAGPRADLAAGFLSGMLGTSTGTSGPPIVLCLQSRGMPARPMRATLSWYFAATGWVSVVLLAARGHVHRADVLVSLAAIPILLASWSVGARSFGALTQTHYERLVVALLLAAAAVGLASAL